jgi:tetratricopeptide (TPR) repeat protein
VHARNYYLHAIENIKELAERGKDPGDLRLLYGAYALTGELYRNEGDYANAADYWSEAFEVETIWIESEPDESGHYSAAGISSQRTAYCFEKAGEFKQAYRYYERGLEYIRDAEDNRFDQVFTYGDMSHRTFDLFRAEACLNMARLQSEHYDELFNAEEVYRICSECIQSLFHVENLDPTEDRRYDTIHGAILCSSYVDPSQKGELLDLADSLCNTALENCTFRMRFLKLRERIEEARKDSIPSYLSNLLAWQQENGYTSSSI